MKVFLYFHSNIRKWVYFLILENDLLILENDLLLSKNEFLLLEKSFNNIRKSLPNIIKKLKYKKINIRIFFKENQLLILENSILTIKCVYFLS